MKNSDTYSWRNDAGAGADGGGCANRWLKLGAAGGVLAILLLAGIGIGMGGWDGLKDWRGAGEALSSDGWDGGGLELESNREEEAVTFQPSESDGSRLGELKEEARALRQKRDAVGREIRKLPGEYWDILSRAVESRPDLLAVFEEREDLDRALDEAFRDPRIRDLSAWSSQERAKLAANLIKNGITDTNDFSAIKSYLEAEAGKIRQFYFLHETDRLLSDPASREFAESWLKGRLEPSELDQTFYSASEGRRSLFNSFREFSDSVVPEPGMLRELLERPDRTERIASRIAAEEMDMVDSSLPVGIEELIGKLTKLGMNRAMLEHRLRSEIPELQDLERRRRDLLLEHPAIDGEVRQVDEEIRELQKLARR